MTAVTEPPPRIATLDIVRGVAVMGILAMNIVAFAMPMQVYFNPTALGPASTVELATWTFNFIFIEGKMRGLFSFLFGASMLLVIERAEQSGLSPAAIHYRRMIWLLLFGLIHVYLIWFGDILTLYAAVGMIAFFFRRMQVSRLVLWAVILIGVQFLFLSLSAAGFFATEAAAAAPGASAEATQAWEEMSRDFRPLTAQEIAKDFALYRGSYAGIVQHRLTEQLAMPLFGFMFGFFETLGYMLLGMAGLKSGFVTGSWELARYRRTAMIAFAVTIPAYAILAALAFRFDFGVSEMFAIAFAATVPFRPVMVIGYGALIILLTRSGGALVERIAAAGRAAFTNYLGTSILATTIFYGYGLGLYGTLGRAEVYLVVFAIWALMLLWSKPWLDRYLYGPLEWLWRSLARGRTEPMRKALAAPA
jgi:uncharacterized protein